MNGNFDKVVFATVGQIDFSIGSPEKLVPLKMPLFFRRQTNAYCKRQIRRFAVIPGLKKIADNRLELSQVGLKIPFRVWVEWEFVLARLNVGEIPVEHKFGKVLDNFYLI